LENTDHRQFRLSKEKVDIITSEQNPNSQNDEIVSKSTHSISQNDEEINKTIAYFKISESLDIIKFYDQYPRHTFRETGIDLEDDTDNRYRWGLDISNVQNYQEDKYFIFIAVSRIDVNEDMKGKVNADTKSDYKKNTIKKRYERINENLNSDVRLEFPGFKPNETKRGTAVYRLKLIKDDNKEFALKICPVTYYYSDSVSGICKFIQNLDDINNNNYTLKRFIVLNFNGIYNFEYDFDYRSLDLNTRFDYPKSIENELEHWHKENLEDCMDKILTCLYNQYFLVEQYKNNVQTLEGKIS
jgi:hypothetical protein